MSESERPAGGETPAISRRNVLIAAAAGAAALALGVDLAFAAASKTYTGDKVATSGTFTFNINGGPSGNSSVKIRLSSSKKYPFSAFSYDYGTGYSTTWSVALDGGTNRHAIKVDAKSVKTVLDNVDCYRVVNIPVSFEVPAHWMYKSQSNDKVDTQFRLNLYSYNQMNSYGGTNTAAKATHADAARRITINIQVNLSAASVLSSNKYTYKNCAVTLVLAQGTETVSADPKGGVVGTSSSKTDLATKVCGSRTTVPLPTRSGYKFRGWALSQRSGSSSLGYLRGLEAVPGEAKGHPATVVAQAWVAGAWQPEARDGAITNLARLGTVDGLRLSLDGDVEGGIEYRAYHSKKWTAWASDGAAVGATAKGEPVYALEARLTGEAAKEYDLYFHCHSSTGWLPWITSGASDPGSSKAVTSVQAALVPKGDPYPMGTEWVHGSSSLTKQWATVAAQWERIVYSITYDANGGEGAPAPQEKPWGDTVKLSPSVPTRDSYDFDGWNTSADGSGAAYEPAQAYSDDADLTLYAQWRPAFATVTYYADGEQVFAEQARIGQRHEPSPEATSSATRDNCLGFVGWFTDRECTTQYPGSVVEGDFSLHGYNRVRLDYSVTDRTRELEAAHALHDGESLDSPVARLDPSSLASVHRWGETVVFADWGPAVLYYRDAGRIRRATQTEGLFDNPLATGSPMESARLMGNATMYFDWRAPGYEGIIVG